MFSAHWKFPSIDIHWIICCKLKSCVGNNVPEGITSHLIKFNLKDHFGFVTSGELHFLCFRRISRKQSVLLIRVIQFEVSLGGGWPRLRQDNWTNRPWLSTGKWSNGLRIIWLVHTIRFTTWSLTSCSNELYQKIFCRSFKKLNYMLLHVVQFPPIKIRQQFLKYIANKQRNTSIVWHN